jgi:hypothetical protein
MFYVVLCEARAALGGRFGLQLDLMLDSKDKITFLAVASLSH